MPSIRKNRGNQTMNGERAAITGYLSYALAAAHRSVHLELSRKLKDEGVQVEAWRIMEAIDGESAMTMGRLAEVVLLAPPTLTKMVDRMVADGLVQRQISQEDQRQVHLVLSALGERKRDRVRQFADEQEAALLERLGPDSARLLHNALNSLAM
ncbi:MAG: MarR family transcriptional regulator [Rhodobacteraceae bacterium HLUCCA12]|nr:MAG: MarR family transcriptional regulator [Rhodobacteraceae bacterium HLUCCA12]